MSVSWDSKETTISPMEISFLTDSVTVKWREKRKERRKERWKEWWKEMLSGSWWEYWKEGSLD